VEVFLYVPSCPARGQPWSFISYEDLSKSSGEMQNSQTFAINQLMVLVV